MLEDGLLKLVYEDASPASGSCTSSRTEIQFICPQNEAVCCLKFRSHFLIFIAHCISKDRTPKLLPTNGCQFLITWETEHACAESELTSDTCELSESATNHRVTVDVSSLSQRKAPLVLQRLCVCKRILSLSWTTHCELLAVQLRGGSLRRSSRRLQRHRTLLVLPTFQRWRQKQVAWRLRPQNASVFNLIHYTVPCLPALVLNLAR